MMSSIPLKGQEVFCFVFVLLLSFATFYENSAISYILRCINFNTGNLQIKPMLHISLFLLSKYTFLFSLVIPGKVCVEEKVFS